MIDPYERLEQIENNEFITDTPEGDITFHCRPEEYGLIAEPVPAQRHYNDDIRNYVYDRKPKGNDHVFAGHDESKQAMKGGWVIPAPAELFVHTPEDRPVIHHHLGGYTENYRDKNGLNRGRSGIISLDTRWAISTPQGVSIFVVPSSQFTDSRFDIIPFVLDSDEFPLWLEIPIIIQSDEFRLHAGTPIAKLIPFYRDDYKIRKSMTFNSAPEKPSNQSTVTHQ